MYSKLTNSYIPTNKYSSRNGNKICKITPHHMCAVWSGKRCAEFFRDGSREASANYCIGVNGDIACNVPEELRAWTSSSYWNDSQAITIECANSSLGGDYPISQATWDALVNLCVDICQRYGFTLDFTGDCNGSLTCHYMYASTSCPGAYMKARMDKLAAEVNAKLGVKPEVKPQGSKTVDELAREVIAGKWGNGADRKNRLEAAGYSYAAVQGRVDEILSGAKPSKPSKSIDEVAKEVLAGAWGNGQDRINRLQAAGYNYNEIQNKVNEMLYGSKPAAPSKSVAQIAQEVLDGKWGNGADRQKRLAAAGYDYNAVQNKVNEILYGSSTPKMSARQFALEVWNEGKHGKGADRAAAAKRLGVNYNEAQRLINILASGGRI